MSTHYTTCLYIHGLHSCVMPEKRKILEKLFPKVIAHDIDYGQEFGVYERLKSECEEQNVDFIVGSSFGGYLGFFLAAELQLPSVFFNPALLFRNQDKIYIKKDATTDVPYSLFVMGEKDDVIPAASTHKFLNEHPDTTGVEIMKCSWMEHRVDLPTFESMITSGLILAGRK